jgi:polar amino acid transport system substrate-binding protein
MQSTRTINFTRIGSLTTLLTLLLCLSGNSIAGCTRVINVPVAATGLSVTTGEDGVSGVYPELLRSMSEKNGCSFNFSVVPRARLELMFENGTADLMFPAKKTAQRDQYGIFVPLIINRAKLMSIDSKWPELRSAQDLIDRKSLRLVVVRGYDYGPGYMALINELNKQKRLIFEADPTSVARILKAGGADLTIMTPYILVGAMSGDARIEELIPKLRYESIDELPWGDSGMYLSKAALNEADKSTLTVLLEQAAKSGQVWKSFQHYYPDNMLKESMRPLLPLPK